jgi:hypothetical protein
VGGWAGGCVGDGGSVGERAGERVGGYALAHWYARTLAHGCIRTLSCKRMRVRDDPRM